MNKSKFAIIDAKGIFLKVDQKWKMLTNEKRGNRTIWKTLKGAEKAIMNYGGKGSTGYRVIKSVTQYSASVYEGKIEIYEYQSYLSEMKQCKPTKEEAIDILKKKLTNKIEELQADLYIVKSYK